MGPQPNKKHGRYVSEAKEYRIRVLDAEHELMKARFSQKKFFARQCQTDEYSKAARFKAGCRS